MNLLESTWGHASEPLIGVEGPDWIWPIQTAASYLVLNSWGLGCFWLIANGHTKAPKLKPYPLRPSCLAIVHKTHPNYCFPWPHTLLCPLLWKKVETFAISRKVNEWPTQLVTVFTSVGWLSKAGTDPRW